MFPGEATLQHLHNAHYLADGDQQFEEERGIHHLVFVLALSLLVLNLLLDDLAVAEGSQTLLGVIAAKGLIDGGGHLNLNLGQVGQISILHSPLIFCT